MSGVRSTARWRRARAQCLARSQVCGICGEPIDLTLTDPHTRSAVVDHVIPLADGGAPFDQSNLRAAHRGCNIARENRLRKTRAATGATNPSRRW